MTQGSSNVPQSKITACPPLSVPRPSSRPAASRKEGHLGPTGLFLANHPQPPRGEDVRQEKPRGTRTALPVLDAADLLELD